MGGVQGIGGHSQKGRIEPQRLSFSDVPRLEGSARKGTIGERVRKRVSSKARGRFHRRGHGRHVGRIHVGRGLVLRKGEVWWAKLKPPAGRRAVGLLSRDAASPG